MRFWKQVLSCAFIIGVQSQSFAKSHFSPPQYLNTPAPAYPKSELEKRHEGRVQIRVEVAEDGAAHDATVMVSSGFLDFDKVAVDAVNHWKFIAAKLDGHPVSTWIVVPVTFSLNDLVNPKNIQQKNWIYATSSGDVDYYVQNDNFDTEYPIPEIHTLWMLKNFNKPQLINGLQPFSSIVDHIKIDCTKNSMQTTM